MKLLENLHQEIIKSDWTKYFEVVKRMNKWEKKAEKMQNELADYDEWVKSNYRDLPESVQKLLSRGQIFTEERIGRYKKLASKAE